MLLTALKDLCVEAVEHGDAVAGARGDFRAFTSPLFRGVPAIPNDANDTMHDDDTGFRCVATPEQMEPCSR
ncbi:hypothetical protein ACWGBH_14810 [Streptomyces massasporeus]